MNDFNIDDENEDYNTEALDRLRDEIDDCKAAAVDHIQAAKRSVRICIRVTADVRVGGLGLAGRALDDHLEQLVEVEGDLSRAEGELS